MSSSLDPLNSAARNALAAIHQRARITAASETIVQDEMKILYKFDQQQYTASVENIIGIRHQKTTRLSDKTTILAANALFWVSSIHRGNIFEDLAHLNSGRNSLDQWKFCDSGPVDVFEDGFVECMWRWTARRGHLFGSKWGGILVDTKCSSSSPLHHSLRIYSKWPNVG